MVENKPFFGIWMGVTYYWAFKTKDTQERLPHLKRMNKEQALSLALSFVETGCRMNELNPADHFDIHVEAPLLLPALNRIYSMLIPVQGTYPMEPTVLKESVPLFKDMVIPKFKTYDDIPFNYFKPHWIESSNGYFWEQNDCNNFGNFQVVTDTIDTAVSLSSIQKRGEYNYLLMPGQELPKKSIMDFLSWRLV